MFTLDTVAVAARYFRPSEENKEVGRRARYWRRNSNERVFIAKELQHWHKSDHRVARYTFNGLGISLVLD